MKYGLRAFVFYVCQTILDYWASLLQNLLHMQKLKKITDLPYLLTQNKSFMENEQKTFRTFLFGTLCLVAFELIFTKYYSYEVLQNEKVKRFPLCCMETFWDAEDILGSAWGGNTLQGSEGGRVGLRKTLQMRSQLILQGVLEQA